MNSSDEILAIKEILCARCLEAYEGKPAEAHEAEEKDDEKQTKDFFQMAAEAQEMEICIRQSLSPEKRDKCWVLVASVLDQAVSRAQSAVSDCIEQDMLYSILMSEAWKAAQSYDPTKSQFSTWVFRPWGNAIHEFWRLKNSKNDHRKHRKKKDKQVTDIRLSACCNDPDNQTTLLDRLKDENTISPEDFELEEITDSFRLVLTSRPLLKAMINVTYNKSEWLCVYCRRGLRLYFLHKIFPTHMPVAIKETSIQNVYERRRLWINFTETMH